MKGSLYVGLLMVVVVIVVVAFSAKTFHASAQDMSPITAAAYPPPGGAPATLPTQPSYQPLTPPPAEPSLTDLIAKLRDLRKQEEQLTKTIKQKIMAQKKSLEEAEKEMNSIGIEATEHSSVPLTSSDLDKTTAPHPDKLPPSTSTNK